MAYITGNRAQRTLLPSCIDEFIGPDDPVRAYDALVDRLDVARLGIVTDPHRVGAPEFDPRAMLKLLVYGYSYGIRSSRQLERATYHNLSFIWLLGGLQPDHKTIARFRRTHRDALAQVLTQCAQVCLRLGLIAGNTLFVDGTKIRANASMKQTWTPHRAREALTMIDQRIAAILTECEVTDHAEAAHPSAVHRPRALRHQQALRATIHHMLDELGRTAQAACNTTDPDAGRMRMGNQLEMGYNCQSVVDETHGLIVHSAVVQASNDVGQFATPIRAAQATLGAACTIACADAGYYSPEDLTSIQAQGVEVVVPLVEHSDFRTQFTYEAPQNQYRCPEGHTLRYAGKHTRHKSAMYAITDAALCRRCPRFGQCTTAVRGRWLERPWNEALREQLAARYAQADVPALMRRRKVRAEAPFGHIKHNLGMRTFLLRGLHGVRAEFALAATAFNIRRILTLLGVHGVLQQLTPLGN